ncbi:MULTISPECIES: cytochrome b561 [Morganella]|uniref:cytochrome b561 n=1 Tax=Morganella TaxID=581 RepID=UPI001C4899FE|nr:MULTISPECIES: cytochrome b561 [Morganella]QXO64682.1 cytochrome b561 [Morganella morganii]
METQKFRPVQIALHWFIFLLVIVVYISGLLRDSADEPLRSILSGLHYSCGISVGILMIVRLAVRIKHRAPAIIPKPSPAITGLSHLVHLMIFVIFILLPVLGFSIKYLNGYDWSLFGIPMPVSATPDEDLAYSIQNLHEIIANTGYFIIGLHAAAALAHHYFWKDNTLLRMMPRKRH